VKDANGQSLAYVYGRETRADADIANVLTMKLARLSYNAAAWAEAYSMGTFIVALIIFWLLATGESLP